MQASKYNVDYEANLRANRIFCTALPLLLHLLNTNTHLHEGSASPNAISPSSDLRAARVQRSQYPDWVRKVIDGLRVRFRHELDYILRTVQAVNTSLFQEFEDIREEPFPMDRQEYVLRPDERSLRMSNWRELLNTRPKLYARLIVTMDSAISWGGPLPETDMPVLFTGRQSSLHQQFRMAQKSPSLPSGDEPVSHVESCRVNADSLRPADLNGKFDSILLQQTSSPGSDLNEAIGEIPSPIPSDPSSEIWREEIMDSGRTVLDQVYVCDDAEGVTNDFRNIHEFMLGDGQNDDWMGVMLVEDMSLSGDDMSKGPDYARTDACMTV